jgi:circadian clock protein KaiB
MIRNADAPSVLLPEVWIFKLYVCGQNQRALTAYSNLKKVCEEHLNGQYQIEVVDLVKNPQVAYTQDITACPTVIKESPSPKRVVIGDMSKTEVVLAKLDFPVIPIGPNLSRGAKSVSLDDICSKAKEFASANYEANLSFTPRFR